MLKLCNFISSCDFYPSEWKIYTLIEIQNSQKTAISIQECLFSRAGLIYVVTV